MPFIPSIPEALAGRLRWQQDSFHASAELKGNMALDSLFAQFTEQTGQLIIPCSWYPPSDFEQKFGIRYSRFLSSDDKNRSWVDAYLMNLLARAMEKKASDIHITYMGPYAQIAFRRMGLLMEEEPLNGEEGLQLIRGIFQGHFSQSEASFSTHERYDGRIADRKFLPDGLFAVRLHSEPIQSPLIPEPGVCLAMRLLFDATSATGTIYERLSALGFTAQQQEMIHGFTEHSGLAIVSGPTGHGKSTTLKNIMESMALNVSTRSYWALEDPPEYTLIGVRQANVFTKATTTANRRREFEDALAGLMRSDPDVLLIGEIRYREAAEFAINAAMTGHGVWTTVHANSAIGIVNRIHEMGIELTSFCDDNVLNGLIYQRLLPILCPDCKKPLRNHWKELPLGLRHRLMDVLPRKKNRIYLRGEGCPRCDGMGLIGQKVAAEVIPANDRKFIELLQQNRLFDARRYWLNEMRGQTHVTHALSRIEAGEVDPAIAEERLGVTLDYNRSLQGAA